MEVGTTVNTVDELKQKWAKFKAQEVLAAVTNASLLHMEQPLDLSNSHVLNCVANMPQLISYMQLYIIIQLCSCIKAEMPMQAEQAASSNVVSRGVYTFKFNAENLVKPYSKTVSRIPELTTVSLSQEMHATLTSKTTAMIGGNTMLNA